MDCLKKTALRFLQGSFSMQRKLRLHGVNHFLLNEIFLFAALFLCRIPLDAALSIVLIATAKAAFAASASLAATAASTPLIVVFTLDIALLFLKATNFSDLGTLSCRFDVSQDCHLLQLLRKNGTGRGSRCIYNM